MWITRFARLPLASLLFKGQDTEHTTGKWPIEDYYCSPPPRGWARWRIHEWSSTQLVLVALLLPSAFEYPACRFFPAWLSWMCHLVEGHLKDSLPTDISSVYHWYSKRLETELKTKLQIEEQHFLYLLSAITASRESLPVGFVSKVLVPGTNSSTAKRKVRRALGSVSTLLPIHDDCLHSIHKSVKHWLTDTSCYGEHEFIMDKLERQRILAVRPL